MWAKVTYCVFRAEVLRARMQSPMFSLICYSFFPSTTNIGNVLEAGWSLSLGCREDNLKQNSSTYRMISSMSKINLCCFKPLINGEQYLLKLQMHIPSDILAHSKMTYIKGNHLQHGLLQQMTRNNQMNINRRLVKYLQYIHTVKYYAPV